MCPDNHRGRFFKGRGAVLFFVFLVFAGAALYSGYYLQKVYKEKDLEIQRLNEVVGRLKAESRIAQVLVKEQGRDPETGYRTTTIKFAKSALRLHWIAHAADRMDELYAVC